jgi:hypothetical protein
MVIDMTPEQLAGENPEFQVENWRQFHSTSPEFREMRHRGALAGKIADCSCDDEFE